MNHVLKFYQNTDITTCSTTATAPPGSATTKARNAVTKATNTAENTLFKESSSMAMDSTKTNIVMTHLSREKMTTIVASTSKATTNDNNEAE